MVGRKRSASGAPKRVTRAAAASRNALVPEVVRDLLSEVTAESSTRSQDTSEREPKRRKRPGERPPPRSPPKSTPKATPKSTSRDDDDDDDDEDVEFEDVPAPVIQTITREEDEDDDDDIEFEDVEIAISGPSSAVPAGANVKELSLNLTVQKEAMTSRRAVERRRKAIGREEKERRANIHKTHVLCFLSHVERRNWWCNNTKVQAILKPLLTAKTIGLLNPRPSLNQFGKTESLKTGIKEASDAFRAKFRITERGLRRALWPEDEEQLKDVGAPLLSPGNHCSHLGTTADHWAVQTPRRCRDNP